MGLQTRLKPHIQDWMMRRMDDLRSETLGPARGEVLEVGFGTGLNLPFYPAGAIASITGLDPMVTDTVGAVNERVARSPFPVSRTVLRADGRLPFDAARFDTVVTTWTLCSIADAPAALREMRRVLRPGGRYLFIEHGYAPSPRTQRWQNRLNPVWKLLADGCNMNRPIDRLVVGAGFELTRLQRFRGKGPGLLAHLYRGVAARA